MPSLVVLLRAIGPATHKLMTMRALEAACRDAGLPDTSSVLATGNLVVRTDRPAEEVGAKVLGLLAGRGVKTAAIVCDADRLRTLADGCPDPDACAARPAQVQVVFLERAPTADGIAALRKKAGAERIERVGADLWIDYRGPISASKLTAAAVERALGCTSTARNWNTVLRLAARLADPA